HSKTHLNVKSRLEKCTPRLHATDVAHTARQHCSHRRFSAKLTRLSPRQIPHSARGTAFVPIPRFRALALFGRRPPQLVDSLSCRRPKTCTQAAIAHLRVRSTRNAQAARGAPVIVALPGF